MTAANYTAMRSELAKKIGLGRKAALVLPPPIATKAPRKPRAKAANLVEA